MMSLRGWIMRLERRAREDLESFELLDGSIYYYDPTSGDCFLHSMDCLGAQGECEPFPEPPETLKAIARARDRRAALNQLYPNGSFSIFPYEPEALVESGELVPRSMVVGRELGEPLPDLSEQSISGEAKKGDQTP
jgi:hypothetical protein